MNKFESYSGFLRWFMALLLVALAAGCGGGSGKDPILGAGGAGIAPGVGAGVIPPGAVIPGPATCAAAVGNPLVVPTVTSSDPTSGNQFVTTSTSGSTGKLIIANFSLAMTPSTINSPSTTFTLTQVGVGVVPGTTVSLDATGRIATLTTPTALIPGASYTAIITQAATSAAPPATTATPLGCIFAWSFRTGSVATGGQAPINLGTASTYGIFASNAAVTLAANSIVNGDVGLNPAGACNNCVVGTTIIGGVIHNGDQPAIDAQIAIQAAYNEASVRSTNACPVSGDLFAAQANCTGYTPSTPGPVYGPGLYRTATTILLTSTITLDAGGNPDAVFIFQTNDALTTASNSTVLLAGLAQAKNVFWIVGSAATLGVSSDFKGTVIANGAAVSVLNGTALDLTLVEGRLFSLSAAAGVGQFATVTVPLP